MSLKSLMSLMSPRLNPLAAQAQIRHRGARSAISQPLRARAHIGRLPVDWWDYETAFSRVMYKVLPVYFPLTTLGARPHLGGGEGHSQIGLRPRGCLSVLLMLRTILWQRKRKSVILGERNAQHHAPSVRGERICKSSVLALKIPWQCCGVAALSVSSVSSVDAKPSTYSSSALSA